MLTTAVIVLAILLAVAITFILMMLVALVFQGKIIGGLASINTWREVYIDAKSVIFGAKNWLIKRKKL